MLASGVAGNGPLLITGSATGINVPSGTVTAYTTYNASLVDTASAFDVTNGRFTPQVAGYYLVNAFIGFDSNGISGGVYSSNILKNGSVVQYVAGGSGSTTVFPKLEAVSLVSMNGTTDYITVAAFQLSGGTAVGVYAQFQAFLIRSA
jgi:hypothetical protein